MSPEKSKVGMKWNKAKTQLKEISQKALTLAKASETELKKLSHHGRLQFDATALHLRQERLYYLIGKEYVKTKNSAQPSAKLAKLLEEFDSIHKEHQSLHHKM